LSERENSLFPLFLKLEGKTCLVVGAGLIGLEKVETLLRCGARLRVVAPHAVAKIQDLSAVSDAIGRLWRNANVARPYRGERLRHLTGKTKMDRFIDRLWAKTRGKRDVQIGGGATAGKMQDAVDAGL